MCFWAAGWVSSCWKAAMAPAASAAMCDHSGSQWNTRGGISSFPQSSKIQSNHPVLSGHPGRSVVLGGWMGKVNNISKLHKWLQGSCPLVIPCAHAHFVKSLTKGIHSLSSLLAVLLASESLLSVIWILVTSLISSYHQLMNKLFISKFMNYQFYWWLGNIEEINYSVFFSPPPSDK